jgi:hypothetical protein
MGCSARDDDDNNNNNNTYGKIGRLSVNVELEGIRNELALSWHGI